MAHSEIARPFLQVTYAKHRSMDSTRDAELPEFMPTIGNISFYKAAKKIPFKH
jgi:hypothetical protein